MKGFVLLFFMIAGGLIAWHFMSKPVRREVKKWLVINIWMILVALIAVAAAIVFSANTTMRLL